MASESETPAQQSTTPTAVWHYTNFRGLEGILNGTIWGSSSAYLNDEQEFLYGLKMATEADRTLQLVPAAESDQDQLYNRIIKLLDGDIVNEGKSVYVASFSYKPDDLSQWRAYGNTFPKFAVGFSKARLEMSAAAHGFNLNEVWYGKDAVFNGVRPMLENPALFAGYGATDLAVWLDREYRDGSPDIDPGTDVVSAILALASRVKDPAFTDEKEWRLVRRVSRNDLPMKLEIKYRLSHSMIVPFVEIPLHKPREPGATELLKRDDSPVGAVIVGPSPHAEKLKEVVKQMARSKGLDLHVYTSKVPFRNW
jgi:hypothetical protein